MLSVLTILLEVYFFIMNCPSSFFLQPHLGLLLSALSAVLFLLNAIFYAKFVAIARRSIVTEEPSYQPLIGSDVA